jgi:hypothetical protein
MATKRTVASRTWVFDWPTPDDPLSRHSATLLTDDEPVASAVGDEGLSAARNLADAMRRRGVAVEGRVLAFTAFERLPFRPQ